MISFAEQWAPVKGADGYEVSTDGDVRTWRARGGRVSRLAPTPRPVRLFADGSGYLGFNAIVEGGRHVRLYVHRVACMAFHGPPPSELMEARHFDGDRSNNTAGNLSWGTRSDNERDKLRHGTHNRGERHGNAKLANAVIPHVIEMRRGGATYSQIGRSFGISATHACRIVRGQSRQLTT